MTNRERFLNLKSNFFIFCKYLVKYVILFAMTVFSESSSLQRVEITYQLPRESHIYRVSIAIVKADNSDWIVRTLLSGGVREITMDNQGKFTETWDGLDDDGYPVRPGRYTWKGVYMPAVKWEIDNKYHTFIAKLAVAAGSHMHPGQDEDTLPMIFQGVSTSPVNDVCATSDGKLLLCGEYIENGTNPLFIDPELNGIRQLLWGAPSGGIGGVNAGAADEDFAYIISGQAENDFITRYDVRNGGRLAFGTDRGTYMSGICLLPYVSPGVRDTAVSMAALKTKSGKHYVYVPLLKAGKLIVLDGESGKILAEVPGLISPVALGLTL